MAALVLILALALVACAAPLTSGVVVDKLHDPAHTDMQPQGYWGNTWHLDAASGQLVYGWGYTCCALVPVPVPDRWYLVILGDDGRHQATVAVDQATWDRTQVGDSWAAT